jgi:thiopurine S-methyltransferase
MDFQFWNKAWTEGGRNFHQSDFNSKLLQFFPKLNPVKGQSVLVPLCGKSKDLLWLSQLGLNVHGVEFHPTAVEDFFTENGLPAPKKVQDEAYTHYALENLVLSCGDFFKLGESETYDLIYDRASLVALPADLRKQYAQVIKSALKKGGACLLITYDYDQTKLVGPPFSVSAEEVQALYGDGFSIEMIDSRPQPNEGPRLAAVEGMLQKVYILRKNS